MVHNSTYLGLSFFEIQSLDVPQNVKDELTLGILHGLDMSRFLSNDTVDFKVLRGIRLCLEHDVPMHYVEANLSERVLLGLFDLYSTHRTVDSVGLAPYFNSRTSKLLIEESTFEVLVGLALENVRFDSVDFRQVPLSTVGVFASALQQGVNVSDFEGTRASRDKDFLEFLVSLRLSGIEVKPFLSGSWSEEQVTAVIQGRSRVSVVDFVTHYVNEFFTAGQIEQCLRAVEFDCLDLVSSLDSDGYPIYNEYQMYQLVEGARFGLDYRSYSEPSLNDSEMSLRRTELFKRADSQRMGSLSSQLAVEKPRGAFW